LKELLHKYLFGALVAAYVITSVGIPVYFHYCGGELQKIDYVIKASGCCDGEEEQTSDCCQNEQKYLSNHPDFTLKNPDQLDVIKIFVQLCAITVNFKPITENTLASFSHLQYLRPPTEARAAISITVLRI
jgi:hypothetical protein